jgi:hypothetical protein
MARARDGNDKRDKASAAESAELRKATRKSPKKSDLGRPAKASTATSRPVPPPLPPPRAKPPAAKPQAVKPEAKPRKPQPAFPKKNAPPTAAAFAARLPLALGKRFDLVRNALLGQEGMKEDVFFYGPESGWAIRYQLEGRPLCSLHIYDERPIGIISLEPDAIAGVDWKGLSPAGRTARKQAHGSPSLLWLDVDLEGTGAADFRAILRAKLATLGG